MSWRWTSTERGRRFDETVEILRLAASGGPFEFHGGAFSFGPVQVSPKPFDLPLIFGGNGERALHRAALAGDAWFSSGTPSLDDACRLRDRLHAIRSEHGLTDTFRCYVRVEGFDPTMVERYRREGIDDLVFWADQICPPGGDKQAVLLQAAEALSLTAAAGDDR